MASSVVSTAISMDISGLSKGVAAAVKDLNKLNSEAKQQGQTLQGIAKNVKFLAYMQKARLAFRTASVALKGFTKSTWGFIDSQLELVKGQFDVAYSLGLTYNQLQGLGLAAKNAGLTFERLYEPMSKVARKIDDALKGSALMQQNFQRLNIDPNKLKNLGQFDQFKAVTDALNKIPNASERAALAMNLFEESGGKFLQLFKSGSAGLAEFQKQAEKLGLTLKDWDLKKILTANQAIITMKKALQGLKTQVLAEVSPIITSVAEKVTEYLSSKKLRARLKEMFRAWIEAAVKGIGDVADYVGTLLGKMETFFGSAARLINKINLLIDLPSDLYDITMAAVYEVAKRQPTNAPIDQNNPYVERLGRPVTEGRGSWGTAAREAVNNTVNGINSTISDLVNSAGETGGKYVGPPGQQTKENTQAVKQLTEATSQNTEALNGLVDANDIRTAAGVSDLLQPKGRNYGKGREVTLLEKILKELTDANDNKPAPAKI